MMNNKLFLYSGITVLLLISAAVLPMVYYYSKLPSASEVKPGARLTDLFSSFDKEFGAIVANEDATESMICLSCLPSASTSDDCIRTMSSFVAKNLVSVPHSMMAWHFRNAYLTKAISMKYEAPEVRGLYFATLANIFNESDIGTLCQKSFGKSCGQLQDSELRMLQRGFLSGKLPPLGGAPDEAFAACFSK